MRFWTILKSSFVVVAFSISFYGVLSAQSRAQQSPVPCDAQKAVLLSSFQPRMATHNAARDNEFKSFAALLQPTEIQQLENDSGEQSLTEVLAAVHARNPGKDDANAIQMGALLGYPSGQQIAWTRAKSAHHVFKFAEDGQVSIANDPETAIKDEFWDLNVLLKGRPLPDTIILADGLVVQSPTKLSVVRMERLKSLQDAQSKEGSSKFTIRIESKNNDPVETSVASADELVTRMLLPESCRPAETGQKPQQDTPTSDTPFGETD